MRLGDFELVRQIEIKAGYDFLNLDLNKFDLEYDQEGLLHSFPVLRDRYGNSIRLGDRLLYVWGTNSCNMLDCTYHGTTMMKKDGSQRKNPMVIFKHENSTNTIRMQYKSRDDYGLIRTEKLYS